MTRKQKRMTVVFGGLTVLSVAVALMLTGLSEQVTFFRTPSELVALKPSLDSRIRLGGIVVDGSVRGDTDAVRFDIEDATTQITVRYAGILPDLFREGQGIIAEGALDPSGTFMADTVLAKHDETYMPKEVADALKEQGYWQPGSISE
ncbi:MAG: cytochrome c maturation protein CcmE [Pseudomonadota bacterium]